MGGVYSAHGDMGNGYEILVGKPEVKRPLRRPSCIDGRIILKWMLAKLVWRI
jgi:hypothetical protein